MDAARFKAASRIFDLARSESAEERARILDRACGEDASLRAFVETLLAEHDGPDDALDLPIGPGSGLASRVLHEAGASSGTPPERIGPHRVIDVLGEGGMGVVYRAEQTDPKRTVAIKVLHRGLSSPTHLRRFRQEARILAQLSHRGIAQIFEAGVHDGAPYLVMEFIEGRTLDAYLAEESLGIRDRVELLERICDAAAHAHVRGVVHRDLKPGNMLVTASGDPKILDFGVARATDVDSQMTRHTAAGQLLGTLPYMSPEQVEAGVVDARADVYALGVIAYEMFAGRRPIEFESRSISGMIREVSEREPTPLSAAAPSCRGDLETIVMHALEKDRERRYQDASAMRDDLRRLLRFEPIEARPATTLYQLGKFARRHRGLVAGAATSFGVLLVAIVVITLLMLNAQREADRARREAERAEAVTEVVREMLSSVRPSVARGRDSTMLEEILDSTGERLDTAPPEHAETEATVRQILGETYYLIGEHADAERHLRESIALSEASQGPLGRETLVAKNALAVVLANIGRFEEAEVLYRAATEGYVERFGEDDPTSLTMMDNLGVFYASRMVNRPEEGERLIRLVHERRLEKFGPRSMEASASMASLGRLAILKNDWDAALSHFESSYEIRSAELGVEHPDSMTILHNVALCLNETGRHAEAIEDYRRIVAYRDRVQGPEHMDTRSSRLNLASSLMDAGRLEEAERVYGALFEVVDRSEQVSSNDILVRNNYLALLIELGRFKEAESNVLVLQEQAPRVFPEGHFFFAYLRCRLGQVRVGLGRLDEAEADLEAARAMLAETVNADPRVNIRIHESFIELYEAQGRSALAEAWRTRLAALRAEDGS